MITEDRSRELGLEAQVEKGRKIRTGTQVCVGCVCGVCVMCLCAVCVWFVGLCVCVCVCVCVGR